MHHKKSASPTEQAALIGCDIAGTTVDARDIVHAIPREVSRADTAPRAT